MHPATGPALRKQIEPFHQPLHETWLTQLFQPPLQGTPFVIATPGDVKYVGFTWIDRAFLKQIAALEE